MTATVLRGATVGSRWHLAAMLALAVAAVAAPAQTSFQWPDTTAPVSSYTQVDECLAAIARVRAAKERQDAADWTDTLPFDRQAMLRPALPAVTEIATKCAARFTEPTTNLADFSRLLPLYLAASRDSDAARLVARRIAAVPATNALARASVADSAFDAYIHARPARFGAAEDILVHRAHSSANRLERMTIYNTLMRATRDAGDSVRARRAARWLIAVADSLTREERESETFQRMEDDAGGRYVVYEAVSVLAGSGAILDSLRKSTAALVALERATWTNATGERPEALPIPLGKQAPPITADFWFPGDAARTPRPTRGHVSLVLFIDAAECMQNGTTEDAARGCAAPLVNARRLVERSPEVELTIVAQTHGFFMYLQPMSPADEAELIRQWLDTYHIPRMAIAVTSTPSWRLPAPDSRRVNKPTANDINYAFDKTWKTGNQSLFLFDQQGILVNAWHYQEMADYIDVLLHRTTEAN